MSEPRRALPGPRRINLYAERLLGGAGLATLGLNIGEGTGRANDVMFEFVALAFLAVWNTLLKAYSDADADHIMGRVLTEALRQISDVDLSPAEAKSVRDDLKQFVASRVEEYESEDGYESVVDRFVDYLGAAGADVQRAGFAEGPLASFYEGIDPNVYLVL